MTIYEEAIKGNITQEILDVAKEEKIEAGELTKLISKGQVVIMTKEKNNCSPLGIGTSLRTKINVNLGTSSSTSNLDEELKKVFIAQNYGADTISDLSMGGGIDIIRKKTLEISTIPVTTVPIYQTVVEKDSISDVSEDNVFRVIEKQIKDGISSIVIHAGFTLDNLEKMKEERKDGKRIMGIVSKGGSLTASIMKENNIDNFFSKNFDYLIDLIKDYDIVLNLGNAMRSGCIHDRVDGFQQAEIINNNKLAKIANKKGVQVILESLGGHLIANDIIKWVKKHKEMTDNRPLFVSGPLPIDTAVGYDHIAAAIGGAFASGFGADYLCAITPAEHLGLPTAEEIKKGLIACKIASHIGDSMKFGLNHLFNNDLELAKGRFEKDWKRQFECSIDPEEPLKKHPINEKACSMCGKYCALSISKRILKDNSSEP